MEKFDEFVGFFGTGLGAVFITVLIFNIVPFFAPPTWLVLSYFKLKDPTLDTFLLLGVGVVAAALGRFVMYKYSSFFYAFLPQKNKEALDFVRKLANKNSFKVFLGSFAYSLSPLSSNIMFLFAGASRINPIPLFLGFIGGRAISYGFALVVYVNTINLIEKMEGVNISGIADLITFFVAILFMFIDWKGVYKKLKSFFRR